MPTLRLDAGATQVVLRYACRYRLPLSLYDTQTGDLLAAVQLLDTAYQTRPEVLFAGRPAYRSGAPGILQPGTIVNTVLWANRKRYAFSSQIEPPLKMRIGGGVVQATVLTAPARILFEQRRETFRLVDWVQPPVRARFWTFPPEGLPEGAAPPLPVQGEGTLQDLSVGGVGLLTDLDLAGRLAGMTHLGLYFVLDSREPPVTCKTRITSIRPYQGGRRLRVGGEFVEVLERRDYKQNLDRLTRYVVDLERRQLQALARRQAAPPAGPVGAEPTPSGA